MKQKIRSSSKMNGFSLIELMTVIIIVALLIASATVYLLPLLERREVNSTANKLYMALQDTSFIATQRSTTATLCAIAAGQCTINQWASDYGIFASDPNAPGNVKLVRRFEQASRGVKIITDRDEFAFTKNGFLKSTTPLNIRVCHPKYDDYWIDLTLDLSGIVTQTDNFYTGTRPCA